MEQSTLDSLQVRCREAMPSRLEGTVLLVDGDCLCYACAGDDTTSPTDAIEALRDRLEAARDSAGGGDVVVVITARGSEKGFRRHVAVRKPYQANRVGRYVPKNWATLRDRLESPTSARAWGFTLDVSTSEADDRIAYLAAAGGAVIYTKDKDLRMIPGWHLDFTDHTLQLVPPDRWYLMAGGKLWGRAWFWSQMLHGDRADNIPGLPFYTDGRTLKSGPNKGEEKRILCGEKSRAVVEMLPAAGNDAEAYTMVLGLYRTCYGEAALVEMLEQAILLWLRTDEAASVFNVTAPGNPMFPATLDPAFGEAKEAILNRCLQHDQA